MVSKFGKSGKVRPYVTFSKDEYTEISKMALDLGMEKGEFLRKAVMYIVQNKINIKGE